MAKYSIRRLDIESQEVATTEAEGFEVVIEMRDTNLHVTSLGNLVEIRAVGGRDVIYVKPVANNLITLMLEKNK